MGYKMSIICKELYIPVPTGEYLTLQQYKEKYGIDLKEYLSLDGNYIKCDFGDAKVYLVSDAFKSVAGSSVVMGRGYGQIEYESGDTDGKLSITVDGAGELGLVFTIDNSEELSLDNVVVSLYEA